jgi:hypothetical protein
VGTTVPRPQAGPCAAVRWPLDLNEWQTSKICTKFMSSQNSVNFFLSSGSLSVLRFKNMKHMYFMEIIIVIYLNLDNPS